MVNTPVLCCCHDRKCVSSLVCDRSDRLTAEGIIAHPFFKGIDWNTLRTRTQAQVAFVAFLCMRN